MHTYSDSNSQGNSQDVRDSDLLHRYVREQSEQAFADLGRRYAGLVYATCPREIGDRTLAEDATQAVFLLLSQKAATLARIVRRTSLQLSLRTAGRRIASGLSVLIVVLVVYQRSLPERLSPTEQRRFFAPLAGNWQGNLTFADDKTRQQVTYPTLVDVRLQQNTLQLTASYTGSSRVDITTITENPQTGAVSVDNGGAKSSHILSSVGEIRREGGGGVVFQGFNSGTHQDTRLHLALQGNQLTVQEEFRLPGGTTYLFQNRFTLTRK